MANFNLVVDTGNFKPLSYNDMIAPLLKYDKDYDQMQERADKFIDMYGNLNLPEDSEVGKAYRSYLEQQNAAVDRFMREGLVNGAAQDLSRVFMMNKTQVSRMKGAAEAFDKTQDQINQLGPTAIVLNEPTIDDFYKNPQKAKKLNYVDGKAVTAEVAAGTKAVLDTIEQKIELGSLGTNDSAGASQFIKAVKSGQLSIDEVMAIAANPNSAGEGASVAAKALSKYYQDTYNNYGIDTMSDKNRQKLIYRIQQGAMLGMPATTTDMTANNNFLSHGDQTRLNIAEAENNRAQSQFDWLKEDREFFIEGKDGSVTYPGRGIKVNKDGSVETIAKEKSVKGTPSVVGWKDSDQVRSVGYDTTANRKSLSQGILDRMYDDYYSNKTDGYEHTGVVGINDARVPESIRAKMRVDHQEWVRIIKSKSEGTGYFWKVKVKNDNSSQQSENTSSTEISQEDGLNYLNQGANGSSTGMN